MLGVVGGKVRPGVGAPRNVPTIVRMRAKNGSPTPTATAAVMAAPTTNRIHPERNATDPPNVSRRNTYSPAARGISVQSSAYDSPPASDSSPAAIQVAARGAAPT